jgi:hypothetical protein
MKCGITMLLLHIIVSSLCGDGLTTSRLGVGASPATFARPRPSPHCFYSIKLLSVPNG